MLEKFTNVFSGRLYQVVTLSASLVFITVCINIVNFVSYVRTEPLEIEELKGNIIDSYEILNNGIEKNIVRLENIRSGYDYPDLMADIKMKNEEEKRLTRLEIKIKKDTRELTKKEDAWQLHVTHDKAYLVAAGVIMYVSLVSGLWGGSEWYKWDKQELYLSRQIYKDNLSPISKGPKKSLKK